MSIQQIEIEEQQPIDGHHPVVKQLVSAGFSLEESLVAVERFETLERAMNFLMLQDNEEGSMFPQCNASTTHSRYFGKQSSGGSQFVETRQQL